MILIGSTLDYEVVEIMRKVVSYELVAGSSPYLFQLFLGRAIILRSLEMSHHFVRQRPGDTPERTWVKHDNGFEQSTSTRHAQS